MEKIEHVVYLMLENRSLDNVLGWLYSQDEKPAHVIPASSSPHFNGLIQDKYFNKDSDGNKHYAKAIPKGSTQIPEIDPHEKYEHVTYQIFEQKETPQINESESLEPLATMGGFYKDFESVSSSPDQIMMNYTPQDLPIINGLAKNYAVSDAYFSSVPTQTNCNRAFAATGNSLGKYYDRDTLEAWVDNHWGEIKRWSLDVTFNQKTIWEVLSENGYASTSDWMMFYSQRWPKYLGEYCFTRDMFPALQTDNFDNQFRNIDEFFNRIGNDTLPTFSYLEPLWGLEIDGLGFNGNDFHPPTNAYPGDQFLNKIYTALKNNQAVWNKTLLIINFDEHGGTYDHVPPPWKAASPWQNPADGTPEPEKLEGNFKFDRFGVRVPLILVSPYIEESTVFRSETDTPLDHCSVIATILNHFNVPKDAWKLGSRVANAPTFEKVLTRSTPRSSDDLMPKEFQQVEDSQQPVTDLQLMIAHRIIGKAFNRSVLSKSESRVLYKKYFISTKTVVELSMATQNVLNELENLESSKLHLVLLYLKRLFQKCLSIFNKEPVEKEDSLSLSKEGRTD